MWEGPCPTLNSPSTVSLCALGPERVVITHTPSASVKLGQLLCAKADQGTGISYGKIEQ